LPMMSMLRLRQGPGEEAYGAAWTLNTVAPRPASELFPERQTIYVRARYVLAGTHTIAPVGASSIPLSPSDHPVGSPWGTAQFEIAPLALMSQYPTPGLTEKPNVCKEQHDTAIALARPFTRETGYAYTRKLSGTDAGDTPEAPRQSRLQVCEDESPLGPAHAVHDDIRTRGQGRYSHWGEYLYLSTSDNSDPNTNGRRYSIVAE